MKILVCGGRDYQNYQRVCEVLDQLMPITLVIHGAAKGADSLADRWARDREIPVQPVPADWDQYGKAAGHIRNAEMLLMGPDRVVAFPGGRGTDNMVQQAMNARIAVQRILL